MYDFNARQLADVYMNARNPIQIQVYIDRCQFNMNLYHRRAREVNGQIILAYWDLIYAPNMTLQEYIHHINTIPMVPALGQLENLFRERERYLIHSHEWAYVLTLVQAVELDNLTSLQSDLTVSDVSDNNDFDDIDMEPDDDDDDDENSLSDLSEN
jgi:hypothetical protein